jgi:ABC-2 type transport system permease protein
MAGDALLNTSVVPVGVSLAVGLFVVLTFGSAAIFKKESILK